MTIDLAVLAIEINTDPNGYGYSLTDNALTADLLNEPRAAIQIDSGLIDSRMVVEAIDYDEYAGLSAGEQRAFMTLTNPPEVDTQNAGIVDAFQSIFGGPGGVNSRASLAALLTRDGSRAEELFGADVRVSNSNVNEALHG